MGTNDWEGTDVDGIVETLLTTMTEIHHHTHAVHLLDDLGTEFTHTIVLVLATGRVADVVVTIVAKRHIHHSTLAELLHVREVFANGIAVLNA